MKINQTIFRIRVHLILRISYRIIIYTQDKQVGCFLYNLFYYRESQTYHLYAYYNNIILWYNGVQKNMIFKHFLRFVFIHFKSTVLYGQSLRHWVNVSFNRWFYFMDLIQYKSYKNSNYKNAAVITSGTIGVFVKGWMFDLNVCHGKKYLIAKINTILRCQALSTIKYKCYYKE